MTDTRKIILKSALALVPFDGWSEYTLRQAAKRSGLTEADLKRAFPAGARDCAAFFLEEADRVLSEMLPEKELAHLRVPERIEKLILTRLANWIEVREVVRRTISFNALPWNSFMAHRMLYHTVDLMWRLAGDKSTDFSFYTKRATLAAVYSGTVLFWLDDNSENQRETALFLKRRLGNVADFGRFKKKLRCA